MAQFYADAQFPRQVVNFLRTMGHEVLTVQESGYRGASDEEVIALALKENRAILTHNRRDFIRLHNLLQPHHAGIVVCSRDNNWEQLANRIHAAITLNEPLAGKLIRVNRPG
ncbi:DUF5615 family PIN-like protein [Leptodesmis sp.]|uniref:DUF5615 family PIN-like protein n=1 Tax=Leptodesmis sp. TaxID=3100501 RepID=UPI004053476B